MASIDIPRAPADRGGSFTPEHGRREFFKWTAASIAAAIGSSLAFRSGCRYMENERDDLYPLVQNFPTDLKGIHHTEPFPVPGAKQCIFRFVHMHPQARNAAALADVQPDVIQSWQKCGNETANAIADLQRRYPEYTLRKVFCEGVRSAIAEGNNDEPMKECIANVRRTWGQDASLGELWHAATNGHDDSAYEFLLRCGAVAEPVLCGTFAVFGIASEDLDARIAPLMERRDEGAISLSETRELQRLLEEYEEHALDRIRQSGERFPILPLGDDHDMAAAIDRWHKKHPNEPPFSLVNLWPNETAKRWDKHLAVDSRRS